MSDLTEALTILSKYTRARHVTSCEHDILYVQVSPRNVSDADKKRLQTLGFKVDDELDNFYSNRFGSC